MGRTGIGVLWMLLCCAIPTSQIMNVARGKTYNQSSYDAYNYPSSHAANGNTGGTYNSNNCIGTTTTAGTTDFSPWWQVDLGRKFTVYNITVWARARYVDHLYPLNITVDGQQCVRATSTGSRERSLSCTSPITGRVVRLTRDYRKTGAGSLLRPVPLYLCEVQIGATCQDGDYKAGNTCVPCSSTCENSQCNSDTGRCDSCNTGWYGDRCDSNCSDLTSRCTQCVQDDGQCTACSGHFKPPQCTATCQDGEYKSGTTCVPCSSTCENNQCNSDTGRCDTCREHYYKSGTTCVSCSSTCENNQCNSDTSRCDTVSPEEESSSPVVAVVVPVLVVIIIAVVVGIVLFVFFRRRRQRASKSSATTREPTDLPMANFNDVNSYDAHPGNSGSTSGAGGKKKKKMPPTAAKPARGTAPHTSRENPDEPENFPVEEHVYGNDPNFVNISKSRGLVLHQLRTAVAHKLRGDSLAKEFEHMDPVRGEMMNGQRKENYYKNRFNSILPYDWNRVLLDQVDGEDASDYINASFIKRFELQKGYIASQGPRQTTHDDFWRMVWQEKVTDIVMLTNLKEGNKNKCSEYWPAEGATMSTQHMEVTGVGDVVTRAHFVVRTFDIKHKEGEETRTVKQYHYIRWMDHEAPASMPLVNFCRYVRARAPRRPSAPPLLVHCSAGVGRTGTFIALDIAIDEAEQSSEVNLFNIVDRLRDDRCYMVQNKDQYAFLHEAFVEAYISRDIRIEVAAMNTILPASFNRDTLNTRIDAEYEMLNKMRHWTTIPTHTTANMPENTAKNRNPNVLPDDDHLVYITQHVRGRNQYINGVSVATFLHHIGSILTQLPLPNTVIDLWRLVYGADVKLIVSLGDVEGQQDMGCYWPKKKAKPLKTGPYVIRMKSSSKMDSALWSYTLTVAKDDSTKEVRVLHYSNWTGECADDTAEVILLLTTMQEAEKETGANPVIIQCIDGSLKSGVLCALWDVVSRMTHDEELDVYLAARMVTMARPEAFVSVEQYRFCYEVAQQIKN